MRRKKISIIGALVLGLVMSGCASVATHLEPNKLQASGAEITSFSAVEADYDANIHYKSYQGGAGTAPAVYSNQIRLYQGNSTNAGGMLVVKTKTNGITITGITIGSGNATKVGYKVGAEYTSSQAVSVFSDNKSIKANETVVLENINTTVVTFACLGTNKDSRLNVNKLIVTYSGGTVESFTLSYDKNGGSGSIIDDDSPYTAGADVTVKDSTGFTAPTGKVFGNWNTNANGTGTSYDPGDTFKILSNTTLYAQWVYPLPEGCVEDTLNYAFSGITGTGYKAWSDKEGTSGAVYSGYSYAADSVSFIQMNPSPSGIVSTVSGGAVKGIMVNWGGSNTNGRILNFYGKNTAYTDTADLYDSTTDGDSIGSATFVTGAKSIYVPLSDDYEYIGIRPNSGAMYVNSFVIYWEPIPDVAASIIGNSSVDVGTQWSGTVKEDVSGNAVSDVTYSFAASNGAVISSSSTTNGTFTASHEGTVTVSATKNHYVIANKVVTVNAVVTPTITLSESSVSGFTGESFTIVATYSNLTSAFNWSISNSNGSITGSVVSSTGTSTDGTSTFSGKLETGGSASLIANGGGMSSPKTISFTITQTTLDITKSSTTINQGCNETLAYSHNADAVDGVTWTSNSEKVTVSDSGDVSVANDATPNSTAVITAQSKVDSNVSDTCVVTIGQANFVPSNVFENGKRYIIAARGYNEATSSKYYYLPAAKSIAGSNPVAEETTDISNLTSDKAWTVYIDSSSHITICNSVGNVTYYLMATNKSSGISVSTTKGNGYWTLDSNGLKYSDEGTRYLATYNNYDFRYYTAPFNGGNKQSGANIFYECTQTAKEEIENCLITRASLTYDYVEKNGDYTYSDYSNIEIRFGGFISEALWEKLNTEESGIIGFGILFTTKETLGDVDLKTHIDDYDNVTIKNFYHDVNVVTPASVGSGQKGDLEDNFLAWNLVKKITSEDRIVRNYTAVAYIETTNGYVFFNQVTTSVKQLASDMIGTDSYTEDSFDGSLNVLANYTVGA